MGFWRWQHQYGGQSATRVQHIWLIYRKLIVKRARMVYRYVVKKEFIRVKQPSGAAYNMPQKRMFAILLFLSPLISNVEDNVVGIAGILRWHYLYTSRTTKKHILPKVDFTEKLVITTAWFVLILL